MAILRLALASTLLLSVACSGGGGSTGGPFGSSFQLTSMSVPPGAIWQINRPIDFTFSAAVDFSTVSLNSISIVDLNGMPASGGFSLIAPETVRFQPTCPLAADLSDSGLQVGGVEYQISVFGEQDGVGPAVTSLGGNPVEFAQFQTFFTPSSSVPTVVFFDTKLGPAAPVVRQIDSNQLVLNPADDVTYLETAGGAGTPIEFQFNVDAETFNLPVDQGLNLYSDSASQLAVLVEFDQPISPSDENISSERVFLEYLATPGGPDDWTPIGTSVLLERNCSATGATLRLVPEGILPQDRELRVVVTTEFEDLVGERNQLQIDNFAHFRTATIDFPGLVPPGDTGDEIKEDFVLGGDDFGSLEDTSAVFAEPRAVWKDGTLVAAFNFTGTGGSDGAFDWVVPAGIHILLDTSGTTSIQGGDIGVDMENLASFVVTMQQTVVGGQINVRHLVIEEGASIKAQGVNPVLVQASGSVLIRGKLDVSGFNRGDVATLNTGNLQEVGAAGAAGGGRGGTGNFNTTASTPHGGHAFGPFGQIDFGGQGGESAYGTNGSDARRPGGGGGGLLGADATGSTDLNGVAFGMIAEQGYDGGSDATGAVTGMQPPQGGAIGFGPFSDVSPDNDFFGTSFDGTQVILGELASPTAGAGGGAGGNAIPSATYPNPNWTIGTDEKGCGGGGGGGSLRILALGSITFQGNGGVLSNGGRGGAGESTSGLNHVGGGSGGGSGGHIVLEAGGQVVFDGVSAKCVVAQGGKGGKGKPGSTINQGGSGGPGLIQVHVLDPSQDIVFVNAGPFADTLDEVTFPDALKLMPSIGARSRARSKWIAVGGANIDPGGGAAPVSFVFEGTDPSTGFVLDLDGDDQVDVGTALLGPVSLVASPGLPSIGADLRSLTLDASALAGSFDDIYLRNPQLLRDATLELRKLGVPNNFVRYNIAAASSDINAMQLTLEVDGAPAPALGSFAPAGDLEYLIYPNSFRIVTSGVKDFLPPSVAVRFRFEAAPAGPDGLPDLSSPFFVPMTSDIADMNASAPDFIRFEVLFDFDALGAGLSLSSPRPALDFTRIKFRF